MPNVIARPRTLENGRTLTQFTDTTSTSTITYTYPTQQTSLQIENSGEKDITVTVGSYTQTVKADTKWKVDTSFTSFTISSVVDSQEFVATSFVGVFTDLSVISSQLAEKATIVDLFAMGGQSNMQGQSEAPITFELPKNVGYEYKLLTNTLTTVKHPFGENIDDLLLAAHQGYGSLNPKFAEAYCNSTGVAPLMVGVAKGNTQLSEWLKPSARYSKMIEKINASKLKAVDSGLSIRGKYFVWLQGESDAINNVTKDTYKQRFLQFWNDIKAECGLTKCFIIRVAKFYDYNLTPIIKAQEELANENEDIILSTRITGTFSQANGLMQDIWHYTNKGYNLVGSTAGYKIGGYIRSGVEPTLEEEPYPELTPVTYEWNYRSGSVNEVNNKITTTPIGTPTVNADNVQLTGSNGYLLSADIVIPSDFTFSLTSLITGSSVGAMFANGSLDGNANDPNFLFDYFEGVKVNMNLNGTVYPITTTGNMATQKATFNNYVIQRDNGTLKLFFNNSLIGSINTAGEQTKIRSFFSSVTSSCSLIGKVKHMKLVVNGVVAPNLMDSTFYTNGEQGTV